MEINILVFGQIRDIAGKDSWNISGIQSTDELKSKLVMEYPTLASVKFSMAVNKNIIQENTILKAGDTVALLPPFSGG